MRLGQYMDLRRGGVSADSAARAVSDMYLDYSVAGVADRTVRDIIPFAAFLTRTIPQQFGALSRYGAYRSGVASVYGGERNDVTLPPWINEQANVPLGVNDADGNPIVAAGFGLPFESLNLIPSSATIPELARAVRRSVVAQSSPVFKEAYAQISGRDPFFGSKTGSYDRTPQFLQWFGAEERSETGRTIQNLRRVGLTAPLEPFIGQTDIIGRGARSAKEGDLKGVSNEVIRFFTGARLQSVNEKQAVVQQLRERIETDPRVEAGEFLYTRSADPATKALLDAFKRAQKEARE